MRTLEFYSGIGGWSSALKLQGLDHTVVAAFDINTVSNEVYEHNYGRKPSSKSLEALTEKYLNSLEIDLWVMSPPCQPYTRNNETESRDNNDPRSKSFLHLIDLLKKMKKPPTYIALENVVGFEQSFCCDLFINTLKELDYTVLQFHLTPTQFGIPNERPRYYCIAARHSQFSTKVEDSATQSSTDNSSQILTHIPDSPFLEVPELGIFLQQSMSEEELVSLFALTIMF
jgi:tRNA (cytosine38-C5)-methyltransferase